MKWIALGRLAPATTTELIGTGCAAVIGRARELLGQRVRGAAGVPGHDAGGALAIARGNGVGDGAVFVPHRLAHRVVLRRAGGGLQATDLPGQPRALGEQLEELEVQLVNTCSKALYLLGHP